MPRWFMSENWVPLSCPLSSEVRWLKITQASGAKDVSENFCVIGYEPLLFMHSWPLDQEVVITGVFLSSLTCSSSHDRILHISHWTAYFGSKGCEAMAPYLGAFAALQFAVHSCKLQSQWWMLTREMPSLSGVWSNVFSVLKLIVLRCQSDLFVVSAK